MKPHACQRRRPTALLAAALLCLCAPISLAASKWEPITASDLAATAPAQEADARAEILLQRCSFNAASGAQKVVKNDSAGAMQNGEDSWLENYVRTKIYNAKAAEDSGLLSIEIDMDGGQVWNLAARITKPDGSSHEYDKSSFKEAVSTKTYGSVTKSYTFAAPDLKAGDILEMQWMEPGRTSEGWYYCRQIQRDIPIRNYVFEVKAAATNYDVFYLNLPNGEVKKIDNARSRVTFKDVPSYHEEKHAPPKLDHCGWLVIRFEHPYMKFYSGGKEWPYFSDYRSENFDLVTRPGGSVKHKAAELLAGAATDEEKLDRLHEFCRTQIANLAHDNSPESERAKKNMENGTKWGPADTLEKKCGWPTQVDDLFASLCRAAGFEVLKTASSSRDFTTNIRHDNGYLFLLDGNNALVTVKVGTEWKLFSPGAHFLPTGMIPTKFEAANSLLCQGEKPVFTLNPPAPARSSLMARKGRFTLSEDGTLEGDVEVTYSGHFAGSMKSEWEKKVREDVDKLQQASILERIPAAEITALDWTNLSGAALPLVNRYHVKVPGYAETAGDRLIFPADYFTVGSAAIFTEETHKLPVYLKHAWSESDDIEITLPAGYVFDQPTNPKPVAGPGGLLESKYKLSYKAKQNLFTFKRDFSIGGDGTVTFQSAAYPTLKALGEAILASDKHTLIIKPKPAPAQAQAAVPAK